MKLKFKYVIMSVIALALIAIFLFIDLGGSWDYAFPRRVLKVLAMVLTGSAIAYSTVIFQTITGNRILTPSIMGLDSLYILIQTGIVFVFGSLTLTALNKQVHFLLSAGLMVAFAGVLYNLLFRGEGRNIYFLLLVGIVCGTLFSSLSSFMQMLIDPNEFLIVQDRMFASVNRINEDILFTAGIAFALTIAYGFRFNRYLDVLALGRDHAINLGVDYAYVVKRLLIVIAILTSVATALIGPITFLGLLVANIAYPLIRNFRHKHVLTGAMIISIIAMVGGQLIVERVVSFNTTLSVIINLVGGVYFIFLLLKESRTS